MIHLAKNLLFLRQQNNLSQAEVCASLGFKRNTWSNWENNIAVPDIETIVQISDYFKVNISDIILTDLSERSSDNDLQHKVHDKDQATGNLVKEPATTYSTERQSTSSLNDIIILKDQIIAAKDTTIESLKTALALAQEELNRLKNVSPNNKFL